jgi:hypothetical protein
MLRNLAVPLAFLWVAAASASANTILIDDFEDGALAVNGCCTYGAQQFGLDPAHVVGGIRNMGVTPSMISAPAVASLTLTLGDDALLFTSGDTGLVRDAVEIEWVLPAGLLGPANLDFTVEIEGAFPVPPSTINQFEVLVAFETVTGETVSQAVIAGSTPSGGLVLALGALPSEATRMKLLLSENEPFMHTYAISEVRVVTTPEASPSMLLALGAFALVARLLAAGRSRP